MPQPAVELPHLYPSTSLWMTRLLLFLHCSNHFSGPSAFALVTLLQGSSPWLQTHQLSSMSSHRAIWTLRTSPTWRQVLFCTFFHCRIDIATDGPSACNRQHAHSSGNLPISLPILICQCRSLQHWICVRKGLSFSL